MSQKTLAVLGYGASAADSRGIRDGRSSELDEQKKTTRIWILVVTALVALGLCGVPALYAEVDPEEFERRTFTDSVGNTLPYRLFVPSTYDSALSWPIVVFLHGGGSRGTDNEQQLELIGATIWAEPENQDRNPTFVLAPQSPTGWVGYDLEIPTGSMLTVLEILDALEQEFNIDRNREYLTGYSMGGRGTWGALTAAPNRFAAAAPMAGRTVPSRAHLFAHVPIWVWHGAVDQTIPVEYSRLMVQALRDLGSGPRFTEYRDQGHGIMPEAYPTPLLHDWLFAQRLPSPGPKAESERNRTRGPAGNPSRSEKREEVRVGLSEGRRRSHSTSRTYDSANCASFAICSRDGVFGRASRDASTTLPDTVFQETFDGFTGIESFRADAAMAGALVPIVPAAGNVFDEPGWEYNLEWAGDLIQIGNYRTASPDDFELRRGGDGLDGGAFTMESDIDEFDIDAVDTFVVSATIRTDDAGSEPRRSVELTVGEADFGNAFRIQLSMRSVIAPLKIGVIGAAGAAEASFGDPGSIVVGESHHITVSFRRISSRASRVEVSVINDGEGFALPPTVATIEAGLDNQASMERVRVFLHDRALAGVDDITIRTTPARNGPPPPRRATRRIRP